jgi:hypothetical protein
MNTPTTSAVIQQPTYVFNDIEYASVKPETVNTNIGGEQTDQLVADYLNQLQVVAAAPATPQIAKPKVSTGIEVNQQLTAELQKLKDSYENANERLQEKLGNLVTDFLEDPTPKKRRILTNALVIVLLAGAGAATPSSVEVTTTSEPDETKTIEKLLGDLGKTKDTYEDAYEKLNKKLKDLVNTFFTDPTGSSARALASAMICLLVDIQALRTRTEAAVMGLFTELGYLCAENQAIQTEKQGTAGLWGGISMAVVTVTIAAGGYAMGKAGLSKGDKAFHKNKAVQDLEYEIRTWTHQRNNDQRVYRTNLQNAKPQDDLFIDTKIAQKRQELREVNQELVRWDEQKRVFDESELRQNILIESSEVIDMQRIANRVDNRAPFDNSLLTKRELETKKQKVSRDLEQFLQGKRDNDATYMQAMQAQDITDGDYVSVDFMNPGEAANFIAKEKLKVHKLNQAATEYQMKNHALNSSFQIAQVSQLASGTAQKGFEANAIMDSAEANIYRELVQLASQAFSAGESYMGTLINNLLESLLRSSIETIKAIAGGMKGG